MKSMIQITSEFRKCLKKLVRKYPSLRDEVVQITQKIIENPFLGKQMLEHVYKIRLANKDKKAGKSGGFRIITYVVKRQNPDTSDSEWTVFLLFIYDKSELSTVSDSDIRAMIKAIVNMDGPVPEAELEEITDKPFSDEAPSTFGEETAAPPDLTPPSETPSQ